MKENKKRLYLMIHGAMIGAVYVALTLAFAPISFGAVQFRISEALCAVLYTGCSARAICGLPAF